MNEEDKISIKIVEMLKDKLCKFNSKVEIGSQKHVFIGSTLGNYNKKLKLIFQSAKQDIVVYLKPNIDSKKLFEHDFFSKFTNSFPDNNFIVPLIIFELKYKAVTTHQVRQYSEESRMIKHIFPFCSFNLVLIDAVDVNQNKIDRIYMAGNNYNKIINFEELDYTKLVDTLFKLIKEHINYLKTEEFLRLSNFL